VNEESRERLEYLRGEIAAERISYGGIAELESLAEYIDPGDTLLLEWAGVPEQHETLDPGAANDPPDPRDELIDALADDIGSTYGAPNTHKVGSVLWRATLEPDELSWSENLRDHGDVWGDTAYPDHRPNDYGYRDARPEGFDGNAEILRVGRNDPIWWQPPADVPRTSPHFAELRRQVSDLLEYGFQVITVERCEGTDAYGRPIVVAAASLGGIEPYADGAYLRELIGDLVDEVAP
jgi:hypothetical protein